MFKPNDRVRDPVFGDGTFIRGTQHECLVYFDLHKREIKVNRINLELLISVSGTASEAVGLTVKTLREFLDELDDDLPVRVWGKEIEGVTVVLHPKDEREVSLLLKESV